ncbi:MAG: hypothetical protein HYR62_04105 [Actinobacteria bacterium]|nr:hypothetical protein [Actinomycetota bacterium]MBI3686700.1 hypothetical protein [Actinomycetota bacterium]
MNAKASTRTGERRRLVHAEHYTDELWDLGLAGHDAATLIARTVGADA